MKVRQHDSLLESPLWSSRPESLVGGPSFIVKARIPLILLILSILSISSYLLGTMDNFCRPRGLKPIPACRCRDAAQVGTVHVAAW